MNRLVGLKFHYIDAGLAVEVVVSEPWARPFRSRLHQMPDSRYTERLIDVISYAHQSGSPETVAWDDRFIALLRPHLPFLRDGVEIRPDDRLDSLGLDSLATVALLLDVESEYSLTFPDESLTIATFESAGLLWRTVSTLLDQQTSDASS